MNKIDLKFGAKMLKAIHILTWTGTPWWLTRELKRYNWLHVFRLIIERRFITKSARMDGRTFWQLKEGLDSEGFVENYVYK